MLEFGKKVRGALCDTYTTNGPFFDKLHILVGRVSQSLMVITYLLPRAWFVMRLYFII